MVELDINWVRAQFPAFSEPTLQGQAFFENAGGSYTCKPVIDRLTRYYTQRKVQPMLLTRHPDWQGKRWTRRGRVWRR